MAFYIFLIGDGFEHLRASVTLLTGAVCIDLPSFESCHVRLSDARKRERERNGKAVGIKQPFVWISGCFILRMGY